MEGDLIFVNIDPVFNIALEALKELEDEERLEVMNQQKASLSAIQSNVKGNDNIFIFGGESQYQQALQYGRTASSVFRMVMLHAVGIGDFVPEFGNTAMQRNKPPALQFEVLGSFEVFKLFEGENANVVTARSFFAEYDHVFPHFLITSEVLKNLGNSVPFHNTMLIFRNNFTEVIEIITEANATMYPPDHNGEFRSKVEVTCIRKKIVAGGDSGDGDEGGDGRWFTLLKTIAEKKIEESKKDKNPSVSGLTDKVEDLTITDSSDEDSTTDEPRTDEQ